MQSHDVIVVGGGPAGSSAAWELERHGVDCVVLDREAFPRPKLCAGWVTPQVLDDLEVGPNDYPHGLLTFDRMKVDFKGLAGAMTTAQHSVRRLEFDAWLLERSRAPVVRHTVKSIECNDDAFVIDDEFRCRYLIGAGGTRCPVHRTIFRPTHPHPRSLQCVTLELEFPYDWRDGDCHLWFGRAGLPGYSWYVPKARGFLNIGVGGAVTRLQERDDTINRHWQWLVHRLRKERLVTEAVDEPQGYSYFLRDGQDRGMRGRAYVVGDAAGLATRDLCEGIGPAVRSGLLAARSIIDNGCYDLAEIEPFTLRNRTLQKALQRAVVPRELRI